MPDTPKTEADASNSPFRDAMRILYALVAATAFAFAPAAPPRTAVAPGATRRGRDGKIYVGEPEPIEQVGDLLRNLGRGLEQGARGVMDDVFGKQPVLNPIPIEMPPEEPEAIPEKDPFDFPPPSRPHGGDWGLDRF